MESVFRADALKGRVAVVSGGGTGINLGIVQGLLQHGAMVVIGSRRQNVVQEAAARLNEQYGQARVHAVQLDVRQNDSVENFVKEALKVYGRIDIVVNGRLCWEGVGQST